MLQIQLLGQFEVRAGGKRISIASRPAQSLFAFLILTAGIVHRREKLAGMFWPDTSDENARKNLRQELWRIRKAISTVPQPAEMDYLLADEFTLGFNPHAAYWLDVSQLERPDLDLPALLSNLSAYQGELLPGFYEDWIGLERERIQSVFDARMEQLLEALIVAERWIAVQEWSERWLSFGNTPEPAYRALMLASGVRGDIAKVAAVYQRCTEELLEHLGIEPSAETRALYDGLRLGTHTPRSAALQQSGTITFLFTDIEGSTHLLDYLGDHYALVLEKHHEILRAAIQNWNGHEVDTQGDAFFVTFKRALDAVQCVAEAQRALAAYPWPQGRGVHVRMGLHTGEPLISSTGYVGMDVHRAARIGDAGHGGQVLLSQVTRELVIHDLPSGLVIRELGEHRLKDLKYPTPIYQLVIEGLPAEFPALRTKFTGTEAPTAGEPPFKGLQYFEEADSDLFFGRELLTAKLVKRLREFSSPSESPLTKFLSVIIGASGSGKSSLVRAGLIPALKKGQLLIDGTKPPEGSANWRVYIITPTAHPLEALATELTRDSESVSATATLMDDLFQDPRSLTLFLARQPLEQHTLLVLDQFEELFTLCRDEFEREAFIDNLLTTLDQTECKATIILTLRADFYAHLAHYPELRDAVAKQQEYIGPMTTDELRLAIEEPAKRGHWEFEAGLVDLILRDIGDEPGALPLLSHALLETWKRRAGHRLTLKGYADAGGVHGAIAHTAENVYQNLTGEEQIITRNLFLRLTELGNGTEDTRRRASFEELMSHTENAAEVRAVMNILAEARLITLGEDTAEVAHEALIREWPTLREWLDRDREGLQLHRHLTEATHEWEVLDREISVLYRGSRLAQANEWAEINPLALNTQENAFLEASNRQSHLDEQEREAQLQRELEAAQKLAETERQRAESEARSARQLRHRAVYLSIVLGLAVIAAVTAIILANRYETSLTRSQAQRLAAGANSLLAANGDPNLIALLSIRSLDTQYSTYGDAMLSSLTTLGAPPREFKAQEGELHGADFSPDGKTLVTAEGSSARLLDLATGDTLRVFSGHTDMINPVVFSPDGKYILTGSIDGTARLWDVTSGQTLQIFSGESPEFYNVRFSPDGKTIATVGGQKGRVWDVATGQVLQTLSGHDGELFGVAFSPDGTRILTGGFDQTARLWDVATGDEIRVFSGHAGSIDEVTFSPDGNYIATASDDQTARIWDAETGEVVRELIGHQGIVGTIDFSADGRFVLTGALDKTVRLWEVDTGQMIRVLYNLTDVEVAKISRDGRLVFATNADDNTTRVWDLQSPAPGGMLYKGEGGRVWDASFSPDGRQVVISNDDNIARIWDTNSGNLLVKLIGHTNSVVSAIFSADGKTVLTSSGDGTARLWDAASGRELRRFEGHQDVVRDAIFSPDGSRVVTASLDGTARVWDTQTAQTLLTYQNPDGILLARAAFSPDGETVATTTANGKIRLWDVENGIERQVLEGHKNKLSVSLVTGVSFSPDGKYLVTTGFDGTVRLWNVASGKELRSFDTIPGGTYNGIFALDGKYVLAGGEDGTVRLWDISTGKEERRFTGHTSRVVRMDLSPDGKYLLTASHDGTARLWFMDYHNLISSVCASLTRDLTPEERGKFDISDSMPTCPND